MLTKLQKTLLGGVTLGALLGTVGAGVVFAQVFGSGPIRSFDSASASDLVSTASDTFVDMPDMSVDFSLMGSPEPVVVMFDGGDSCPGSSATIRLVVDGTVHSGDIDIIGGSVSGGFHFVSGALLSGSHTAKIQWRVTDGGSVACVRARIMTVLHK